VERWNGGIMEGWKRGEQTGKMGKWNDGVIERWNFSRFSEK